jgi:hypothetical protein
MFFTSNNCEKKIFLISVDIEPFCEFQPKISFSKRSGGDQGGLFWTHEAERSR